jgi:two-component system response regulator FixJ
VLNTQPTVFVIDPDGPTRAAVRELASTMDLQCQEYVSGQEFLEVFDPSRAGCAVLEVKVPGITGLQIQEALVRRGATLPVVFLSARPSVSIAVHAMRAGALHFFEKPFREHDLWIAIQEAVQLDEQRRAARLRAGELEERLGTLTEKEYAVLEMIAQGKNKRAIATELGVSVRTIEHHRTQLMRKLKTNSLAGLLHVAMSLGNGHLHNNHMSLASHRALDRNPSWNPVP